MSTQVVPHSPYTAVVRTGSVVVKRLKEGAPAVSRKNDTTAVVLVRGVPGPRGEPGPAGGTAFTRQSTGPLSALVVVWEDEDGNVAALDYRDDDHIDLICGITVSATAGGDVDVQRAGQLDDASWNWTPGRVWLGVNGALTQTPPADGNDVLIGYAVSPDRIYIELQDPISLEE